MLQFSITNCLIRFQEKYYHYGKQDDPWKCVLAIGGYDSAWLADLVACHILDMTESSWKPVFNYLKIYRDDGVGLASNSTVEKLTKWFEEFQNEVNVITEHTIKFTMDIWKPDEVPRAIEEGVVEVKGGNSMPYLDAEIIFNNNEQLTFGVHFKKNYNTKYVGRGSMHTKEC